MADISPKIQAILDAVLGEQVRGSIAEALRAMNNESQSALDVATSFGSSVQTHTQQINAMSAEIEDCIDDVELVDGYMYLLKDGERVKGPYGPFAGGGGGGGGGNPAVLTVSNTTGWLSKSAAYGQPVQISFNWSSIEEDLPTGDGTLKISVNGSIKATKNIAQGNVSENIGPYLGAGNNQIRATISDVYGNSRTFVFSVDYVQIYITSSFDTSSPFTGAISFPYVPEGQAIKTVHFKLDGSEIGTVTTPVSGSQLTYTIPGQPSGSHSLEVYFTCEVGGQQLESNHLYFEFISIQEGSYDTIITSDFHLTECNQYENLQIEYQVYTPDSAHSPVLLKADGVTVQNITVDRTKQVWSYTFTTAGSHTLQIVSGDTTKTFNLTVHEVQIDIEPVTEGLELYLTSYGRSNAEENPGTWSYGQISSTFTDFNFVSDGWVPDPEGHTVLRVSGDARLDIGYKPFQTDFRSTGKTIEIEFASRDVRDYTAPIITCWAGNRGFQITAQDALFKSAQSEISMQYKDDEHIRLSFVIEKRADQRLVYIYVDGIMSRCVRYPDTDDFSQTTPVNISVGSSDCAVDIYCIRVYNHNLTRRELVNNWICDTRDGSLMLERYQHNNVYNAYGQIDVNKLPNDLPYMILEAPELPQSKGDKKIVTGSFVDKVNTAKSFTFENAQADVQGTSSAGYSRKNYKFKFNGGFETSAGHIDKYAMKADSIPAKVFTFKADVASSEGANNVELVRTYNDVSPYKTPPQLVDPRIRVGIDGFPMVIFHNNGVQTYFLG